MELLEGIKLRKSIRAYTPDPVPDTILMEILEIAARAPSGVNSQPWEFYIIKGEVLKQLKHASLEEYRRGTPPHPELPVGEIKGVAPVLKGVYRERKIALAKQIFEVMEISREDTAKQERWNESMVQFYDAPVAIIIVIDQMLEGGWPVLDIGFVSQNITLAALAHGLGTCVMRAIVDFPRHVRKIARIPETKRIIIGIAMGYPDWNHPVNRPWSHREKIEKIVTIVE